MKKIVVFWFFMLRAVAVLAASDPQTELAAMLHGQGIILVHNSSPRMIEIRERDAGKLLLCFSHDYSKQGTRLINQSLFFKDGSTLLVRCHGRSGLFTIEKGFI